MKPTSTTFVENCSHYKRPRLKSAVNQIVNSMSQYVHQIQRPLDHGELLSEQIANLRIYSD